MPGSPSDYGQLLARAAKLREHNAALELELETVKSRKDHSTAKLAAIVTICTALAGSPGLWQAINYRPPPPPQVTRTDADAWTAGLQRIDQRLGRLETIVEEQGKARDRRLDQHDKILDRFSGPRGVR